MLRVLVAFLTTPFVGVAVAMLLFALWSENRADILLVRLELEFATIFAYVTDLLLGAPLFVLMWRFRWLSLLSCVAVAVGCAVVAWLIVLWPYDAAVLQQHGVAYGMFGLLSALAAAVLFWFIAIRKNAALTNRSRGTL